MRRGPLAAVVVAAAACTIPLQAADPPRSVAVAVPALKPARPYWIELTLAQREALAPLADDWERLDAQTKKKWVEIAQRYPRMKPEEQQHAQQRMREWAMLTPEQRRVARDSFTRVRGMNPEQRAEVLKKYRDLPDDRKQQLTTEGQAVKALVVPRRPTPAPAHKVEIREGAKEKTPAAAVQKAPDALVAPARPRAAPPAPAKPEALP